MGKLATLAFIVLLANTVQGTEIPLIGIDKNGDAIEESIGKGEFNGWMKKAISSTEEIVSTDPGLKVEEQAGLTLKQVDVGLGFKAQIGLGDVVKASIEPTVTFKFKRSK